MTANQRLAVELATGIMDGTVRAPELTDQDWHLLLLAAGLNQACSLPLLVAHRALQHFEARAGYFSDCDPMAPLPGETAAGHPPMGGVWPPVAYFATS